MEVNSAPFKANLNNNVTSTRYALWRIGTRDNRKSYFFLTGNLPAKAVYFFSFFSPYTVRGSIFLSQRKKIYT